MKYIVLFLMWSSFGIVHSALISIRFTSMLKRVLGRYFAFWRLIYNLISLGTFVPLLIYTNKVDDKFVILFSTPWNLLQYLLLGGSVLIILIAFISYDLLEFSGLRQIINLFSDEGNSLNSSGGGIVKTGLLGLVRHPIYFATIIFMWSLNATLADIEARLILTIYIFIGTILEEKKLVREYGPLYIDYQKQVPMMIPFLKSFKHW